MNKLKRLVNSQTFKVAIATSLIFSFVAAAVIVLLGWLDLQIAEQDEIEKIEYEIEEIIEFIQEDGINTVIAEHSDEFGHIWPDEEAVFLLSENEVVIRISQKGQTILGFEALNAPLGWSWIDFPFTEHESEDTPRLRTLSVNIENDINIIGALPHGFEYQIAKVFLQKGILGLFIVVTPLALLMAFLISRYVFQRLENISHSIEKVSSGDLEARVPTSNKNDEFDQLSKKMNAMLDQINNLMRNVEDVSVGIAHDLKTPLTRLDQRLQYIKHDINKPEEIQKHLEIAHTNIQTLLGVFSALLRLGEIDSGKRRDNFTLLSFSEIVDDIADTYAAVFHENNRQFNISIMPDLKAMGDRDLIAQLISNLLENTLQHANENAQVWLRLQLHNAGIVLQIGDDGPGIPKEERERIFERFYRLDKSRNTPGNGLGLSLVESICTLHGASIHLYPDQPGTVIDIIFPVKK